MNLRRRSRDRGAAAVETALTIPLLLVVVFGIIDFGRLLNTQISVSAAAREGARAEAVGGSPQDRVNQIMGLTSANTAVVDSCGSNPGPADDAVVTVTVTDFEFITPLSTLAGITFGGDLTSTGVTPCRG